VDGWLTPAPICLIMFTH